MTTKYIHIKKPPRNFLEKRKDFSRQGTILSQKANINNITYQSSKDMSKLNTSNFQSIFEYLYPHSLKKPVKSERKYFKSVSQMEISQLKNKIQLQNKKRQQKSLKSLLLSHLRSYTERSQNKSLKRQNSFTKRLLTSTQSDIQQKQIQKNQQNTQLQQKQRKLLESTNFSIRAISYLNTSQQNQQGKTKMNTSLINSRRAEIRASSRLYFSSSKKAHEDQDLKITQTSNLQNNEPQIDIKLSIKSMTKSEQGEAIIQLEDNHENDMNLKDSSTTIKNFEKKLIKTQYPQRKIKNPFTQKNHKHNHLLIRFDKRLLLSTNQINDPCLKIQKIKSISSRTLTQPNY